MKKFVAMIALGLAIAGTASAQNAPQSERSDNHDKSYNQNRIGKKGKGEIRKDNTRWQNVSPEQRATQRTERLSQKLDLSNKQKKQLQTLNLKQAQQMAALRNQDHNPGSRNENQGQEMKRLRASWEKDLKGILSKKQYAKYEAERKQMQAQRSNRDGQNNDNTARFRRPYNG